MSSAADTIAGYRVERVQRRIGGRTLALARAPDGSEVLLRIVAEPEAPARAERIARLHDVIGAPLLAVLDTGAEGDRAYVAHPVPDGGTLAGALEEGPLEQREAVRLLSQLAGALESLTALGLPHGEVTPATVLLTARHPRQALLGDYGFGIPAVAAGADAAALDAVAYRAPELARGEPVEPQTSTYALACILVECLTGAPPYTGARPLLTVHAHQVAPPPRLSERRDDLPPALDAIVAGALTKAPEQRPQSPGRLMEAVQRALKQRSPIRVLARPRPQTPGRRAATEPARPAAPRRASHPDGHRSRRRWRWSPAAIALSLGLLASSAGFAMGEHRPTAPAASTPAIVDSGRAAYTRAVDGAVQELAAHRRAGVAAMRVARTAGRQRIAALGLEDEYTAARDAVAHAPGAPAGGALPASLGAVAVAYRHVAAAADARDPRSYRRARAAVARAEGAFARALAPLVR